LKSIRGVKRLFSFMTSNGGFELDLYMRNKVLLMHGKCRMMIGAHRLFDEMLERNFFSWNTIIEGLLDSEDYLEAFQMFLIFWEEFSDGGSRTFAMIIQASAVLSNIFAGRQFH